ncbi:MAG: DUF1631 family protein [Betaproteobacteria bacterium]
MTSASLSFINPTLIDGISDQLADNFSRRVFDAVPDISECVEFESEACTSATGKKRFERASQLLMARRRDLQTQTAAAVRRIFDEKLGYLLDGAGTGSRVSLGSLSLLTDDRLDEEIAINHCSRRLKEQCEFELWGLNQRVATLTGRGQPDDSHNPVFPLTFAQALMEGIASLETDAGVRLVVFKTFGPVLLEIVPAVYAAANADLTARGIDIESGEYYGRPILTPERHSPPLATDQEIALGATRVNQELTSALTQILTKTSTTLPVYVEPDTAATGTAQRSTAPSPSVIRPDAATAPAWHAGLREITKSAARDRAEQPADGRTLHEARRALQDKLSRDEQVISDIVTVMFDRLRTEPRMPPPLRDIVARLQLPVLELALRDRSLLTQVQHPVRKLIDLIAEFGLTVGLGDDDTSTLRSVENIIEGVIQIHHDEPNAFKLAFERLDQLFYHHEEAALLTDTNLRALERHEAVMFAGHHADREIALRLQNLTLPAGIGTFLMTVWREVLVHNHLHGGLKGAPWKLGLATLDDILKSLRAGTPESERRRLAGVLPHVIEFLLNSLDSDDDHDVLAANFFVELNRAHELAIAGKWDEIGGERVVPPAAALLDASGTASPSATLTGLGLACGDWIETRDFAGTRRWRLNWITSILGTCVFKHYETNSTRNMSCEELRERLASGEVHLVRGLGLADEVVNGAFETVSRKARREEATLAHHSPSAANRNASELNVAHQWGTAGPTQTGTLAPRKAIG